MSSGLRTCVTAFCLEKTFSDRTRKLPVFLTYRIYRENVLDDCTNSSATIFITRSVSILVQRKEQI